MSKPGDFFEIVEPHGADYLTALSDFHSRLAPKSYLEIGTLNGSTLALSRCTSIAVDRRFRIDRDVVGSKPACFLFQMDSDAFFETYDPNSFIGGPIEMAFLDGMHWFEFLLRDFRNTEKHCAHDSIIIMHDCIPPDSYVARRDSEDRSLAEASRHPDWWAGDVWKTALALLDYRPDLEISALLAPPTGLVVVTGLDPASTVLSGQYDEIVHKYEAMPLSPEFMAPYLKRLGVISLP